MKFPTDSSPFPPPEPQSKTEASETPPAPDQSSAEFFVAGIGASAGALEPLSELLKRLPRECNVAVVLVQHLAPNHESVLVDLLNRVSGVPVEWAASGRLIEPGHVYVAPPNSSLSLRDGALVIREANASKESGRVNYFDFLRESIFPQILKEHPQDAPIRIWVPGCATGEEAYSLGIVIREQLEEQAQDGNNCARIWRAREIICRRRSKSTNRPTRNFVQRTKRFSPQMRSCSPQMRNLRRRRKNCSPPTKS